MLDARIPLGVQPIQIEPRANALMRMMQLQGMQQQMRLAELQEQRAQQELAVSQRDQALRSNMLAFLSGAPDVSRANADVVAQTGNLRPTPENAALQQQAMAQQPQAVMRGIPREAIAADMAFNGGRGIAAEMFQRSRPNVKFEGGVAVDMNRVQPGTSIPNVSQSGQAFQLMPDPQAPGGYRVAVPPGAAEAYAQFLRAGEQAKADFDMVRVYNPQTQREEMVPRSSLVRQQPAPQQPQPAPAAQGGSTRIPQPVQQARDGERTRILREELAKTTNPQDRQAIERELARTQGGMPAGPSVREKAGAEALTLGNQQFMKDVFPQVLERGSTAGTMLTTIATARRAMEGMGNTGWAQVAAAAVAPALAAIGVKDAERFATNAQLFQQAAMTRLWETLNEAKGPQTEGDAKRAGETFIRLQDTKQKNLYVLDLAQAVAERDRMRAEFFRQALPLAQQSGDLQEIDRRWAQVLQRPENGLFNMPSMQKWQQAGKN